MFILQTLRALTNSQNVQKPFCRHCHFCRGMLMYSTHVNPFFHERERKNPHFSSRFQWNILHSNLRVYFCCFSLFIRQKWHKDILCSKSTESTLASSWYFSPLFAISRLYLDIANKQRMKRSNAVYSVIAWVNLLNWIH